MSAYPKVFEVIDDFLAEEQFAALNAAMTSNQFPWYHGGVLNGYEAEQIGDSSDNWEMVHYFHDLYRVRSDYFDLLLPALFLMRPKALIRIRSVLIPKRDVRFDTGWHRDYEDFDSLTAVLYMNTCDGSTKFETGAEVQSVANRLAIFDSGLRHSGTSVTDAPYRMLINFNYFV